MVVNTSFALEGIRISRKQDFAMEPYGSLCTKTFQVWLYILPKPFLRSLPKVRACPRNGLKTTLGES